MTTATAMEGATAMEEGKKDNNQLVTRTEKARDGGATAMVMMAQRRRDTLGGAKATEGATVTQR